MTMPAILSSSVGAWADITERKEAERHALEANAEIQETKRYLTRLIESSPDAIIATDKLGNVVLFNEGAETLLGYRARRGRWPPHHAALRKRGSLERACTRDAQARRHGFRF